MRWSKKAVDPDEVRELARRYDVDLLSATILSRRGIVEPQDVRFFLESDLRFVHNPFSFVEMEEAVDRINAAVEEHEKIFVFGDRDVDGITSTVLLVEVLRDVGGEVAWSVPLGDNVYGLTMQTVEAASAAGVGLLIAVDCGVSNVAEIARAAELGMETIIVDHHYPHSELPVVTALLDPRLEDSGYPFSHLSACAVASKLAWALRFSRTPFYGRTVVVLHVRPVNEAFLIEAIKLVNLVETGRLRETIVPGVGGVADSRLAEFAAGCEIVVYDAGLVERQIRSCFGPAVDVEATDLAPLAGEAFPALAGKSLLKIKELSRMARYEEASEVDVLANLFVSLLLKREGLLDEATGALELVALSILADNMPLVDENRILVRAGLAHMGQGDRRGLRELLLRKGLWGKRLDARSVACQVSPVLNASGRMGEPDKAVSLLLGEQDPAISDLVQYIDGLNSRRRRVEDEIWQGIQGKARESHQRALGRFVMVADRSVQRGVTGILATRLSRLFRAPALVAAFLEDRIVGSLRSPRSRNVKLFLEGFADLLADYGGHDFAAGFNMPLENLDAFEERFYRLVTEGDPASGDDPGKEEALEIDAEIPQRYLTPALLRLVERFEPYGEGNSHLVFMTRDLVLARCEPVGRRAAVHLRMLLAGERNKWPAIWWNAADRLGREFDQGDRVDVVYRASRSDWRGRGELQLTVLDVRR